MSDTTQDAARYAEWARRLAADDATALRALFEDTYEPLWRSVVRLVGDEAIARDLAQDAFVRVWDRRATLDPSLSLRALLYRTVRNLALNQLRDDQTRRQLLADPSAAAIAARPRDPARADAHVEAAELAERIRAYIAELPPRQREALVLSRFDGLSHQEIADVMGCAPRTVNNHLVRALEHLRARLASLGTVVSAVALSLGGFA
ncbi:MAG TPA: RNA polymerase sigma-70 factor [Gemmatimonadaceae bacterium]|nr:RNA polymerase sigma-70 factor [Gemmatimonadaceae bacterium]